MGAEVELLGAAAQFGVAGLIGWMWLTERRAAAARERQITELHGRVMRDQTKLDELVGVVTSNTQAMTSLEAAHRALIDHLRDRGAGPGKAA